jgi:hypothetical protein
MCSVTNQDGPPVGEFGDGIAEHLIVDFDVSCLSMGRQQQQQ